MISINRHLDSPETILAGGLNEWGGLLREAEMILDPLSRQRY